MSTADTTQQLSPEQRAVMSSPVSAERQAIYEQMTPATREMADSILHKQSRLSRGTIEVFWDIGNAIVTAESDKDTKYGPRAVEQLQAYIPMSAFGVQKLSELKLLAKTYSRDELRIAAQRLCINGKAISLTQWIRLASVQKPKDRQSLTERIFSEGLSLSELEGILRSGTVERRHAAPEGAGRPPAIPTSPLAVAQKFGRLCATVKNFQPYLDKNLFATVDKLDTADSTIVANTLEKLKEAKKVVQETQEGLAADLKRFNTMIKDVESRLVEAKKEESAPPVDDDATDVPAAKPAGKPAAKPAPAKPPAAKAPAKPSGKPPAKAPAKPSGKPPAKAPAKPSGKPTQAAGKGKKPVKA